MVIGIIRNVTTFDIIKQIRVCHSFFLNVSFVYFEKVLLITYINTLSHVVITSMFCTIILVANNSYEAKIGIIGNATTLVIVITNLRLSFLFP